MGLRGSELALRPCKNLIRVMPAEGWSVMKLTFAYMIALCLPGLAQAQSAAPLDEIIVTSLGRDQQFTQVPDSVTLFDAKTLRRQHLTTLDDIVAATPGVFLIANDQDFGTNLISVRGISTNRGQEPSVAFVVDGQPLPELELFTLRPYDLARVEVLKGPQSALFGRSASGGAIVYSTHDPGEKFGGYVQAGYGNGSSWTVDAAMDAPLNDRFKLRVSGSFRESNGFTRNSFLNLLVDDAQSRNLRLKANWLVSENVSLNVRAGYGRDFGGAANVVMGEFTQSNAGRLDSQKLQLPYGDLPGFADRRWWGIASTLKATLGNGNQFQLLAAYDDYDKKFIEEFDFLPFKPITYAGDPFYPDGVQPIRQPIAMRALTVEARYTSRSDAAVRSIAGVFFQNIRRDRLDDFEGFFLPPFLYRTKSTQFGVFGQVQTNVATDVEITAALRFDRDDRRQQVTPGNSSAVIDYRSGAFSAWQPKLSVAWTPSDMFTAYATASIGFKQGGFNPLPVPTDPPYALTFPSEKTKALEVGLKAQALDGRMRFTLAGYLTRLNNFQNTVFLTNNIVFSVPKVRVRGVEASVQAKISDAFRLDTGLSFTDARVISYVAPNPTPEPGEAAFVDYNNKHLVNAPSYTFNIGATWQHGAVSARLDYVRTGKVYFELDNILHAPPHGSVDARIALEKSGITAELWAKNLTNQRWATSAFGQQQLAFLLYLGPGGPYDSYTINNGRQWGASVKLDF
jgi:iron complex outermembrane recepter protein